MDSVSGQPVPHALVRLAAPSPRAMLTDSEGKFQFEALPAGSVTLEAEKPGYLGRDSIGPNLSLPVSVQLTPDSPPAVLKLTPENIIFGQVTGDRGEPLEGFTVMIWSHIFNTNLSEVGLGSTLTARTDDEGKFRIAKLSPGSYVLLVNPPQGVARKSPAKSSIPSGYVPVIYSGASDLDSAIPVKLLPGKSQQVNFSLKREPFVRLSGTVSGYNSGDRVTLNLRAAAGVQDPHIVFDPANGSFHTDWIPPGPYTLLAQATSNAPPEASVSSQSGPALQIVQAQEPSPFFCQPTNQCCLQRFGPAPRPPAHREHPTRRARAPFKRFRPASQSLSSFFCSHPQIPRRFQPGIFPWLGESRRHSLLR